jgi:hypothetical protein
LSAEARNPIRHVDDALLAIHCDRYGDARACAPPDQGCLGGGARCFDATGLGNVAGAHGHDARVCPAVADAVDITNAVERPALDIEPDVGARGVIGHARRRHGCRKEAARAQLVGECLVVACKALGDELGADARLEPSAQTGERQPYAVDRDAANL